MQGLQHPFYAQGVEEGLFSYEDFQKYTSTCKILLHEAIFWNSASTMNSQLYFENNIFKVHCYIYYIPNATAEIF